MNSIIQYSDFVKIMFGESRILILSARRGTMLIDEIGDCRGGELSRIARGAEMACI